MLRRSASRNRNGKFEMCSLFGPVTTWVAAALVAAAAVAAAHSNVADVASPILALCEDSAIIRSSPVGEQFESSAGGSVCCKITERRHSQVTNERSEIKVDLISSREELK
jgi:hypothetical protein